MPDRPLRLGLAGLGRFGRQHAAVISAMPGVELLALADADAATLETMGRHHRVPRTYNDALELIGDPDLDAIVLATPDAQHHIQARAALERGLPLLLEKPMATSWLQGLELAQLAEARSVPLQIGLLLRHDPVHQALAGQVQAGALGALISMRAQRNGRQSSFARIADHVHTVYRTLIHDIDLVLWLGGSPVQRVMAMEHRRGTQLAPQGVFALLQLADGSVAQLESSWSVPDGANSDTRGTSGIEAELAVVGWLGSARLHWGRAHDRPTGAEGPAQPPQPPASQRRLTQALRLQLSDFITSVRRGTPSSIANLADAVEGLRIAEAIIEAAASGAPVELQASSAARAATTGAG